MECVSNLLVYVLTYKWRKWLLFIKKSVCLERNSISCKYLLEIAQFCQNLVFSRLCIHDRNRLSLIWHFSKEMNFHITSRTRVFYDSLFYFSCRKLRRAIYRLFHYISTYTQLSSLQIHTSKTLWWGLWGTRNS